MDLMGAGGWGVRLNLAKHGRTIGVACGYSSGEAIGLRRFSGPVLRVGIGDKGHRKTGAVFPGVEFLEGDEPSSDVDIVGEGVGYRPSPAAYQVTCPSLAVLKDDVLCGMMWNAPQWWQREAQALPAAEFASPNFLDGQPNHRIACFVPDAPWRSPNQPVAAKPYELEARKSVALSCDVFVIPGDRKSVV